MACKKCGKECRGEYCVKCDKKQTHLFIKEDKENEKEE